jgi:hypothetical protein
MIDQLMALFADWRAFEAAPLLSDGVPDYRAPALQDKKNRLPAFQERLTALTSAGWPVALGTRPCLLPLHLGRTE